MADTSSLNPTGLPEQVTALHAAAVEARKPGYVDPSTGFRVTSAIGHLQRGYCCGEACRHCPFEWASVTFAKMPKGVRPPPPVSLALMAEVAPELLRT